MSLAAVCKGIRNSTIIHHVEYIGSPMSTSKFTFFELYGNFSSILDIRQLFAGAKEVCRSLKTSAPASRRYRINDVIDIPRESLPIVNTGQTRVRHLMTGYLLARLLYYFGWTGHKYGSLA